MRWSLIILTYDAEATIERCLHSIARVFDGEELEVLIHDNGSRDATVERLRRISESGVLPLRLYLSPRNQGTTVPRNRLARLSRGEFLIVLDADTELVQLPPVELAERLRAEPLTLIAPELRLGDGSVQDSVRPFPTVGDKLRRAWGIVARAAPLTADRYHLPRQDALDVDCAMAACWVLTRQLWERVGELDERIFYSPEDLDWCLRCWRAGGRIRYDPRYRVNHFAQKLSHRRVFSRENLRHASGLAYYFAKHRHAWRRPRGASDA